MPGGAAVIAFIARTLRRGLVHRPGNKVMILAREKQVGQGRRERRYAGISTRPRTQIRRSFAAARARETSGTEHYYGPSDVVFVHSASGRTSRYCRSNFAISANAGAATT